MSLRDEFVRVVEARLQKPPAGSAIRDFGDFFGAFEHMAWPAQEAYLEMGALFLDSRAWWKKVSPRTVKAVLDVKLRNQAKGKSAEEAVTFFIEMAKYPRRKLTLSRDAVTYYRQLIARLHACRAQLGFLRLFSSREIGQNPAADEARVVANMVEAAALVTLQAEPEVVLNLLIRLAECYNKTQQESLAEQVAYQYVVNPHNYVQWKLPDASVRIVAAPLWKHLQMVFRSLVRKARPNEQVVGGEKRLARDLWGEMKPSTVRARQREGIDPAWVCRNDVARQFGFHRRTLQRWEQKHPELIAPIRRNRRVWYRLEDIDGVRQIVFASPRLAVQYRKKNDDK